MLRNKFSNCVSESTCNKFDCRFSAKCTQLSTTEFQERCSDVKMVEDDRMTTPRKAGNKLASTANRVHGSTSLGIKLASV